jgi:hypothetical protein
VANRTKTYSSTITTAVNVTAANILSGQVGGNTAAVNNSTEKYPYARAVLSIAGTASAPTAGSLVGLYAVRLTDAGAANSTAGSGVTSTPATPAESGFVTTSGAEYVGAFALGAVTSAQTVEIDIDFPALQAKFFLSNTSGVTVNQPVTLGVTPWTDGST